MATNSETPQKKQRKDMTEDERRAHDSANRKKLRDARSSQKKTAGEDTDTFDTFNIY